MGRLEAHYERFGFYYVDHEFSSGKSFYKALRYSVGHGEAVSASATLNGPFIGLTGYW